MRRKFRKALTPRRRRHVRVRAKVRGYERATTTERVSVVRAHLCPGDRRRSRANADSSQRLGARRDSIGPARTQPRASSHGRSERSSGSERKRLGSTRSCSTGVASFTTDA